MRKLGRAPKLAVVELNYGVGMAKARRIARAAHRGRLFGDGLFLDHLDRVEAHVGTLTRDPAICQAAMLYTGVPPSSLARQGISRRAVSIVEALQPAEYPMTFAKRILNVPGAGIVWYAVLTDLKRTGHRDYSWRREAHEYLADQLSLPLGQNPELTAPHPPEVRACRAVTLPGLDVVPCL